MERRKGMGIQRGKKKERTEERKKRRNIEGKKEQRKKKKVLNFLRRVVEKKIEQGVIIVGRRYFPLLSYHTLAETKNRIKKREDY